MLVGQPGATLCTFAPHHRALIWCSAGYLLCSQRMGGSPAALTTWLQLTPALSHCSVIWGTNTDACLFGLFLYRDLASLSMPGVPLGVERVLSGCQLGVELRSDPMLEPRMVLGPGRMRGRCYPSEAGAISSWGCTPVLRRFPCLPLSTVARVIHPLCSTSCCLLSGLRAICPDSARL